MTLILGACVSVAGFGQVNGPDYKAGVGLRLSGSYYDAFAASLKLFVTEQGAVEFNAGGRNMNYGRTNVSVSAAYQHHFPIGNIEGFKWFVGGGLSLVNSFADDDNAEDGFGLVVFPTGGVEYKFNFPLAVSADFRPSIYLVRPYNEDFSPNFGVSARYTFK